jgi:uncharacterized protein YjbI with pentapeptide repeats
MANAEHLEILKLGTGKWNKWREQNQNLVIDLIHADLKDMDLSGVNLQRANLYGANLSHSDLSHSNLSQSMLQHADLSNVVAIKAFLPKSDLEWADLSNSNFSNANLSQSNATLVEVNFSDSILEQSKFTNAELTESNFLRSNLSEVDFSEASLFGANFSGSKLRGSQFYKCRFGDTIFGSTNLNECQGLESTIVTSSCIIDFQTLRASKNLPKSFLKKIGLPELYIDHLPEFYMDALTFYPVFLSHSWENKDFARKLYEALITKGVGVFFDEKKIKPGDDFYESLSKGIEYFDKMILVCSKASLTESWWVDREIDRVLAKERELMKVRGKRINLLIPITVDDYVFEWDGAKKEEIKRYLIGDFREWKDEEKFEKALTDLLHALNVDRPNIKPKSHL